MANGGWVDLCDGESDAEFGVAGLGVELDGAVVVADEAAGDVESEAGSLAEGFGGEEGIEDAAAKLRGNAGTVVSDSHDDALVVAGCKHIDPTSLDHGV